MCGDLFSVNFEADLNDDPGSFGGSTTARQYTDLFGLIIVVIFCGATVGLTVYCMDNSKVEKLINGYDHCGNICGKNNTETDLIPFECSGQNFVKYKYFQIRKFTLNLSGKLKIIKFKKNMKFCSFYCSEKGVVHYCVKDKSVIPFYVKLYEFYWWIPALVWVFSITFGSILCFIFRADKDQTIQHSKPQSIIIMFIAILVILPIINWLRSKKYVLNEHLTVTSILIIIPVVVLIIMIPTVYANFKKVDIIYQLYQEVDAATESINSIWILLILSSIIFAAYVYGMTHCLLYLESFSYPEKIDEEIPDYPIIEYIPYPIATMTQAFLIYTIFLLYEFMKNLQCLMISGCVAQRYFSKNDNEESDSTPLLKHLGTVCCASIILSATFPIRLVVNGLKGIIILIYKNGLYSYSRPLVTGTLFLTRNGLIMTAIHGSSFCSGTIRARKLLHNNGFNAAAISTFGEFTILIWKLILWYIPMVICYFISKTTDFDSFKRELVYLVCCGILIALILDYYSSAFEIIINTIFLCFCEDCLYNNGTSKPYFMSANLAQFVENANKFVDEEKWNTVADKWQGGPGRLY